MATEYEDSGGALIGGTMIGGCNDCPLCGGIIYTSKLGSRKWKDGKKVGEKDLKYLKKIEKDSRGAKLKELKRLLANVEKKRTYTVKTVKTANSKNLGKQYLALDKKKAKRACTKKELQEKRTRQEQMAYARACKARKNQGYFATDAYKKVLKSSKKSGSKKSGPKKGKKKITV